VSWKSAYGQKATAGDSSGQVDPDLSAAKAVLISKYMAQTGNEAFYSGGKTDIDKLSGLFRNNRMIPMACGYDWLIWFRLPPTEVIPVSYNESSSDPERSRHGSIGF
jgi:hypothetical protein